MKLFIPLLSFIVLSNALTYNPTSQRLRRDVSELVSKPQNTYLAPPTGDDIPAEEALTEVPSGETEVQDTAVLGKDGYEYKTVRKLRFRKRRDVSHLNLQHHYLPPSSEFLPPVNSKESEIPAEHLQPSNEYLPPANVKESKIAIEQPKPTKEYLPPVIVKKLEISTEQNNINESEISIEQPKPTKEYLPPVIANELEISTEKPNISNAYLPPVVVKGSEILTEIRQPSNEYLPPAKLEEISVTKSEPSTKTNEAIEPETEAPKITIPVTVEDSVTELPETELPQNSAILLDDGYHYKTPLDIPNFIQQTPSSAEEFLTPLDGDVVEIDGPSDGESAVLAEDGYHYRAIKRRF